MTVHKQWFFLLDLLQLLVHHYYDVIVTRQRPNRLGIMHVSSTLSSVFSSIQVLEYSTDIENGY